jgi:actin-related protein
MSNTDNNQLLPLILDIGSDNFRLGWAGGDFPDLIAPSVYVDISDYLFSSNLIASDTINGLEDIFLDTNNQTHLVGHDALKYQNILNIREFSKESNYNILLKFFYHYYQQLNIKEEFQFKQPLIIITPFYKSELEKTKLQEIFFNSLNFPYILFIPETQAILSTLQKTSGVIVNIGESYTYISTIFHGFTNIMARDMFPITGTDITKYFLNLILSKTSANKNVYLDKAIAKEIKERISLCVLDPNGEKKRVKEGLTKYDRVVNLPDGSQLNLNSERFLLSEPLFDPKIIHVDYMSIAEAISKAVKSWDRENWEELIANIVLSGGSSLISGLSERLELELQKHFSEKLKPKIKVVAASGRENMGWIGASVLYSKDQVKKGWIHNPNLNDSDHQQEDQTTS